MILLEKIFTLKDLPEIVDFIFAYITNASTIGLIGDLGSGKTTFCKELISRFEIDKNSIESPTFVKLYVYHGKLNSSDMTINHYDLYRIDSIETLLDLDLNSRFGEGISIIEWIDKLWTLNNENIAKGAKNYKDFEFFNDFEAKNNHILNNINKKSIISLPKNTILIYFDYIDENLRKILVQKLA